MFVIKWTLSLQLATYRYAPKNLLYQHFSRNLGYSRV